MSFEDLNMMERYPINQTSLRNLEDQSVLDFANNFFGVKATGDQTNAEPPTATLPLRRQNSSFSARDSTVGGGLALRKRELNKG